jgi:protein-tyrosine-phosphatase
MAEGLIRARLERAGLTGVVAVASAGTWAPEGETATAHARTAMAERGIDISAHRSREVTAAQLALADLILVMTASHREALGVDFPDARDKVRLMSSLDGGGWDIADPVGGTLDDYRATAAELDRLIEVGWPILSGGAAVA